MTGVTVCAAKLVNKSILRLYGPDSFAYLQLFLTRDIRHLVGGEEGRKHCIYSHITNTNGRSLVDVFVYKPFTESTERSISRRLVLAPFHVDDFATGGHQTDELLIECPARLAASLNRMLFAMKIRKKLTIEPYDMHIWSIYPKEPVHLNDADIKLPEVSSTDMVISRDPRLPFLGYRILSRLPLTNLSQLQQTLFLRDVDLVEHSVNQYQSHLHSHGVGEGPDDHPHALAFPLQCNADVLNGVSFTKGLHTGDWLTGRNVRRGVDERLMPVTMTGGESGLLLPAGSVLLLPDGREIGTIRHMSGNSGLACMRWKDVMRVMRQAGRNGRGPEVELVHETTGYRLETRMPDWWTRGVTGLPAGHPGRFPTCLTAARRLVQVK